MNLQTLSILSAFLRSWVIVQISLKLLLTEKKTSEPKQERIEIKFENAQKKERNMNVFVHQKKKKRKKRKNKKKKRVIKSKSFISCTLLQV
jgi:hypothetical protein